MEIHRGDKTQSQLQVITLQSFRTIKTIVSAPAKLILIYKIPFMRYYLMLVLSLVFFEIKQFLTVVFSFDWAILAV